MIVGRKQQWLDLAIIMPIWACVAGGKIAAQPVNLRDHD